MKPLVTLTTLSLILTGCASAPEHLGKVSVINEVVKAFEDAGGACDGDPDQEKDGFYVTGSCSPTTEISIFSTMDERDAAVDRILMLRDSIGSETPLLVGENWIINSDEASNVQEALGGDLVTSDRR